LDQQHHKQPCEHLLCPLHVSLNAEGEVPLSALAKRISSFLYGSVSLNIHGDTHQIRREAAELHRIGFTAIACTGGIALTLFVGTKKLATFARAASQQQQQWILQRWRMGHIWSTIKAAYLCTQGR
jgi:hypothetical protein